MVIYPFKIIYLAVFVICEFIHVIQGSRILGIFTLPAKSHFICNHAVMKSLIDAGHEVTIVTPFPEQALGANYTSIIGIPNQDEVDLKDKSIYSSESSELPEFVKTSTYEVLEVVTETGKKYCDAFAKLPEIRNMLKSNEKLYDVVFVEILFLYECYFSMAEKWQIPIIGTVTSRSWIFADRAIGNPYHPGYIPFEQSEYWEPSDFFWRLWNVWDIFITDWYKYFVISPLLKQFHQENVKLLGPGGKFINMEPALTFYNSHPSYLPRPMNPNAIEIGGINVKQPKPLPKDIRKFIDQAKHGVILFSFGSVTQISILPKKILRAFREAFAEIPQRVIWKFEQKVDNVPDNVMLMEWLPQRDILEHENVVAFISHCGQGGTYDAIYSGTPILGIPLCADQPSNAAILEKLDVTVLINIENITKQSIIEALNTIINNTKYYNNMQKLKTIIKDRPMTPQQAVVYWTEYVIRYNGATHLKTAATQLNWFQYLLLDVLGVIFLVGVIILCILVYILKFVHFHLYRLKKKLCKNFNPKNKDL